MSRRRNVQRVPNSYQLAGDDLVAATEIATGFVTAHPANAEVYDPSDDKIVPADGAWALIIRQLPAIEGQIDQHVRVGRVFYIERLDGTDDRGFLASGQYKVISHTPWGDVQLWPYEYSIIAPQTLIELWQAGELLFHPTAVDKARFNEVAFYARSRGIGLADAAVIALGTLTGSVGWFEPPADLAEQMEAFERRINRWPPLPPRERDFTDAGAVRHRGTKRRRPAGPERSSAQRSVRPGRDHRH